MRRNCTILNQVYRMLFVTNTSSPSQAKLLRSLNEFIDTVNYYSQPRWIPEYLESISPSLGPINHRKLTNECYPIFVHHQQDIQIHSCMLSLVYWNFPCHYIYFELQSSLFPNQIHTLPTLVSTIWLAKNNFIKYSFVFIIEPWFGKSHSRISCNRYWYFSWKFHDKRLENYRLAAFWASVVS